VTNPHPPGVHRLTDPDCPESLRRWKAWLAILDCPCASEWQSLGTLYRMSMGKGWVRVTTEPDCPHHGPKTV
jgi:hypothetical protein